MKASPEFDPPRDLDPHQPILDTRHTEDPLVSRADDGPDDSDIDETRGQDSPFVATAEMAHATVGLTHLIPRNGGTFTGRIGGRRNLVSRSG